MLVFVSKGEKFFIFADSHGFFTIVKRDGGFRSRFSSGSQHIINMDRMGLNVIYSTPHTVGFIKFLDSTAGSILCDVGKQTELIGAYFDMTMPSTVYAGTK